MINHNSTTHLCVCVCAWREQDRCHLGMAHCVRICNLPTATRLMRCMGRRDKTHKQIASAWQHACSKRITLHQPPEETHSHAHAHTNTCTHEPGDLEEAGGRSARRASAVLKGLRDQCWHTLTADLPRVTCSPIHISHQSRCRNASAHCHNTYNFK